MSISVVTDIGVSVCLSLKYDTIKKINALFNKTTVFISGIRSTPIHYIEHMEYFDTGILQVLTTAITEEEFNHKLANIAELRVDDSITCLRRKREFIFPEHNDYTCYVHDDESKEKYNRFELGNITFHFFVNLSSYDANFNTDDNTSYDMIGSLNYFVDSIKKNVEFFKTVGITEDEITISSYNVCNM